MAGMKVKRKTKKKGERQVVMSPDGNILCIFYFRVQFSFDFLIISIPLLLSKWTEMYTLSLFLSV